MPTVSTSNRTSALRALDWPIPTVATSPRAGVATIWLATSCRALVVSSVTSVEDAPPEAPPLPQVLCHRHPLLRARSWPIAKCCCQQPDLRAEPAVGPLPTDAANSQTSAQCASWPIANCRCQQPALCSGPECCPSPAVVANCQTSAQSPNLAHCQLPMPTARPRLRARSWPIAN